MKFKLSPGQIEAIRESTHSLNIWYGSVSSGKTFAWLLMMLGEINTAGPNGSIVIMGKTLDSVWQNIFEPLLTNPIFGAAAPHIFYRRRQPSAKIFGRDVTVIGVNDIGAEGRIRGGTYQLVFYDELTLCPEPVWEMIWSRMRAVGNPLPPRVFATTNPATPTHYLKTDFIDRADETDTYARLFTMDDNPGLAVEYRERMRASYTGVFYRRMILGEWAVADGAIYETWDQETMVADTHVEHILAVGIDYGTNHPTAGYAVGVDREGRLCVHREWSPNTTGGTRRRLTDSQLADSLEAWLSTLPTYPKFIYCDPAAASFREELKQRRITNHAADNHVLDGIRTVDSLLTGGKLIVDTSCQRLIEEIVGYRWDTTAANRGKDAPIKENDDHCDALRYAVFSPRHLWRKQIMLGA